MTHLRAFVAVVLGSLAVAGCERAAQPTPNQAAIQPQPAVPAVSEVPRDSLPADMVFIGEDTHQDTADHIFASDDAKAARAALEAQLGSDQFNSTDGVPSPYGTACHMPPVQLALASTNADADVRVVFVRPRVVSIGIESGRNDRRIAALSAEITRLALITRGVNGQWSGMVRVTRDTLWWHLQTLEKGAKWTVCGLAGHETGWTRDFKHKPLTPWLPIDARTAESGPKVNWDSNMSWAKLRLLADSVSKLPSTFVVEGNPEPNMPMHVPDICPGEGCSFGEWLACDTVSVLKEAKATAPVAFTLHRGDTFTAVTGDVHIAEAGKVVFSRKVRVDMEGTHFLFTPADTVYPLLYEGEGFGSWFFRGKEGGGFWFFGNATDNRDDIDDEHAQGYSVVRPSKSQWWVKARTKNGEEGWFRPTRAIHGSSPHYEEHPLACSPAKV